MVDINWENLGFDYISTGAYVVYEYSDGKWGKGKIKNDPHISLHIAASSLHYGQAISFVIKDVAGATV